MISVVVVVTSGVSSSIIMIVLLSIVSLVSSAVLPVKIVPFSSILKKMSSAFS